MSDIEELRRKFKLIGMLLLKQIPQGEMISPTFAWQVNSLSPESGRLDAEIHRSGGGNDFLRGNSAWFAMAEELHMLNERREFLIAIEDEFGDLFWGEVSLLSEWDFVGAGSALGITGAREGFPGFAVMSLDGESVIVGHSTESLISFTGASELKKIPEMREVASRMAFGAPHFGNDAALGAKRWLGLDPSAI